MADGNNARVATVSLLAIVAAVAAWVVYSTGDGWRPSPPEPAPPNTPPGGPQQIAPQLSGPDAPVFVRFTLDNSYPEPAPQEQPPTGATPPSEQRLLEAALQILPPRRITLPAPSSIAALIEREYGLVGETHPSAVSALSAAVRFWNDDRIAGEIISGGDGTVRVPLVAPLATNDNALFASVTVNAGNTVVTDAVLSQPTGLPLSIASAFRPRFTNYFVHATVRNLDDGQPLQTLGGSPRGRILAKPIEIALARQQPQTEQPAFTPPLDDKWKAILKNGNREVVLYVLDTGWPDETSMHESVNELQAMSATARSWYHFPAESVPTPSQFKEPKDAHVQKVHAALRELRSLSDLVRVVYVPMTLDQDSAPLLREFVTLGLAIGSLDDEGQAQPEPSTGGRIYRGVTTAAVEGAMATTALQSSEATFTANLALLRGLFRVAQMRGRKQFEPYFVSQSWTTADADVVKQLPESPNGLVVAAVGNISGVDVVKKLAFAGWSDRRKEVLAVMTFDDQGNLACNSSHVTLFDGDLGAVGYDGRISPPSDCASSYATPRVAWYLAAKESIRNTPIVSYGQWVDEIRRRITGLRTRGAPLPQSLLFDPVNYLSR